MSVPALEPLTVAEVRAHLRLDDSNVEPAPSAPLVELAGAGAGNVNVGMHRYRLTFVTVDGETQGGDISESIDVLNGSTDGKVFVLIECGGPAVTARKLYRTKVGGDDFFLVATINNNTATQYTDNVADNALGVGVPTQNTTGDPTLRELIAVAREHTEHRTNRALIESEWRLRLPYFPACGRIELPMAPLRSITSITYRDAQGDLQTLAADQYDVNTDATPGRIVAPPNVTWPAVQAYADLPVTIVFKAGYGTTAASVPSALRHAMKLLIGDNYEHRETHGFGQMQELPAYRALIESHRLVTVH